MSSLTRKLETARAMIDIIDAELQADCGLSLRWYDVLVHLEDAPEGLRMNELAGRILASKSGLTRVVDNMDKAGLVRRERPEDDRRTVLVFITPRGGCRRSVPVSRDLSRVIGSLVSPRSFSS